MHLKKTNIGIWFIVVSRCKIVKVPLGLMLVLNVGITIHISMIR